MNNNFGLDRFGATGFGSADFYYTNIIEIIPKFYLTGDDNSDSDLKTFMMIFEDIFDSVFDLSDYSKNAGVYVWESEIIEYDIGYVLNRSSDSGETIIKIDDNALNDLLRIPVEDGRFIKIADTDNISRYIFWVEENGFGVDNFGDLGEDFGENLGGFIYVIPKVDSYQDNGFGLDEYGYEFGGEMRVRIKRYDLITYLASNYGVDLDRYMHSDERVQLMVDSLYLSSVRGHDLGYQMWAKLYGFLFDLYEVYKLNNFPFFKDIDKLNNSYPSRYLFNDAQFKDYYKGDYFIRDGAEYVKSRKYKYYPMVMVMDEFACDPDSNNSLEAKNYPSLDVYSWMINTENPINNPINNPNPTNTWYDDFSYYTWEYSRQGVMSKYAGLVIELTQIRDYYPELSDRLIERLIKRITDAKPIHIKFLYFIIELLSTGVSVNVNVTTEMEDLSEMATGMDVLAYFDCNYPELQYRDDDNGDKLDTRPNVEFTDS